MSSEELERLRAENGLLRIRAAGADTRNDLLSAGLAEARQRQAAFDESVAARAYQQVKAQRDRVRAEVERLRAEKERAEQAEAERDRLRGIVKAGDYYLNEVCAERDALADKIALEHAVAVDADMRALVQRAEQAEATVERARRMAQVWVDIRPTYPTATHEGHVMAYAGQQILAALETPEAPGGES